MDPKRDICKCGHSRADHPLGGYCTAPRCAEGDKSRSATTSGRCSRFTWSHFAEEDDES